MSNFVPEESGCIGFEPCAVLNTSTVLPTRDTGMQHISYLACTFLLMRFMVYTS